jgi:hypothetical protein
MSKAKEKKLQHSVIYRNHKEAFPPALQIYSLCTNFLQTKAHEEGNIL